MKFCNVQCFYLCIVIEKQSYAYCIIYSYQFELVCFEKLCDNFNIWIFKNLTSGCLPRVYGIPILVLIELMDFPNTQNDFSHHFHCQCTHTNVFYGTQENSNLFCLFNLWTELYQVCLSFLHIKIDWAFFPTILIIGTFTVMSITISVVNGGGGLVWSIQRWGLG